jgi:ABC-type transport system involved in Fe-S cluster assembly fused permease/ATPase subunit
VGGCLILGVIAGIANLVLFIIFWVKMAGYRTQLRSAPKGAGQISSDPDILD